MAKPNFIKIYKLKTKLKWKPSRTSMASTTAIQSQTNLTCPMQFLSVIEHLFSPQFFVGCRTLVSVCIIKYFYLLRDYLF